MLSDKNLLITGVITRDSIAWEAARQAQEAGAEVGLTEFVTGEILHADGGFHAMGAPLSRTLAAAEHISA